MSEWPWLDEISEMLRPQSKLRVVFHPTGRDANEDLHKLLSCIKTLRAALDQVVKSDKLGEQGDPWFYRKGFAIKALAKCAEGKFDE